MNFAINYLGFIVAAVAGILISAVWYSFVVATPARATRAMDAQIAGRDPPPSLIPIGVAANILSAFVLAVVVRSTGAVNIGSGLTAGALIGIGAILPVIAVIHSYGFRPPAFIWIDGAEWVLALLVMGAIVGAFG
jgi:hypothetical protein